MPLAPGPYQLLASITVIPPSRRQNLPTNFLLLSKTEKTEHEKHQTHQRPRVSLVPPGQPFFLEQGMGPNLWCQWAYQR